MHDGKTVQTDRLSKNVPPVGICYLYRDMSCCDPATMKRKPAPLPLCFKSLQIWRGFAATSAKISPVNASTNTQITLAVCVMLPRNGNRQNTLPVELIPLERERERERERL